MADAPQMMPMAPAAVVTAELSRALPRARAKNSTASEPNTNCSARVVRSVPTNMAAVKTPHSPRNHAIVVLSATAPMPS